MKTQNQKTNEELKINLMQKAILNSVKNGLSLDAAIKQTTLNFYTKNK